MAEAMLANRQINKRGEMISETTKTKDNCFILPSSSQQMAPPPPSNATDTLKQQQQHQQQQHHKRNEQHHPIIGIIPSNKRQKLAKPAHELIRTAVEGINSSISKSDRLSAIGAACATFDHDYSSTHDDEVRLFNADSALLKHLTLLLYRKSRIESNNNTNNKSNSKESNSFISIIDDNDDDMSSLQEEVGYTCSALEMVCRCNATTLSESFNKFGCDLLEVLVFILKDFYRKDNDENGHENEEQEKQCERRDSVVSWDLVGTEGQSQSNTALNKLVYHSYNGDYAVNKATKILCHIARVGSAIEPLAKAHDHNIIQILKNIVDTVRKDDGSNYQEARLNTLWIIANLACAPENMVYMASYNGLLDTLLKVVVRCGRCNATGSLDDEIDNDALAESFGYNTNNSSSDTRYRTRCVAARGQAVRAFLNLSWAEENKLIFSSMTILLKSLIDLISPSSSESVPKSSTALSVLKSSKRHAAGTLRNIAAVQNNKQKLYLCTFDNNILIQSLLNALQAQEIDDSLRERIFATFYNLCCDETIHLFKEYPNLLQIFQDAASSTQVQQQQVVGQDNQTNTTASDIQELAERILKFIQDNTDNKNVNNINVVIDNNADQQQMNTDSPLQHAVIVDNTNNTATKTIPNDTFTGAVTNDVTTNMPHSSSLDLIHIDAV